MTTLTDHNMRITEMGFSIIENIYSQIEIDRIIKIIDQANSERETFRRSKDLFAILQFLKEIPEIQELVLNTKLKTVIRTLMDGDYFIVKSIYFDKPQTSNWYVAYHQDLTISVDKKLDITGYGPWTVKQNQFAVQPPIEILENIVTIRIHLDDTDGDNGALKVIPKSHAKKIYRPENIDWNKETEVVCAVPKGGAMLMKPLLLHSSSRTTNNRARRVIHIEFSNKELPDGLEWSERLEIH
ncbi:MAG: phytanoyl-CoA dioxygenase family protein [Bacteroidetes bacterium]|nr:phytanoyl-CoA dioxygenase family protein [Bacteroidota bacterium]